MIIKLEDLAAKRVKSSEGLVVSDHTFEMSGFSGQLIFTGKGTRGIVIKNPKGEIKFQDCVIDNAGTGVVIKLDGKYDGVKLNGSGTTKLFGKAGNSQSQMIYFQGTWSNVEVCGFDIDQRRDNKIGSTTTGSCLQMAGVLSSTHSLGNVHVHDMILRNCGDEGNYENNFERGAGYAQGEYLTVENVKVFGSGRDFFQQWGFKNATYRNCYGENGGKEADSNHCSALSMNGWTEELLIEDCQFDNVAQLIYSGTPAPGKKIFATIRNVVYNQGTHAGNRNNGAAYLKGPGLYRFENCLINAPEVKLAAITADGCTVELLADSNKITAPDVDRLFNGGSVTKFIPPPVEKIDTIEVTRIVTTPYNQSSTTEYFLEDGSELILKQP